MNKLITLFEVKTEKYKAQGDSHPEAAAKFDVEGFLNLLKNQMIHIDQLIDEEIEDTRKTIQQIQQS